MKSLNNNKGFTLVEMIVVIAIFTIVFSGIFAFFNSTGAISLSINSTAKRQNYVTNTMQFIRSNLANATEISAVDVDEAINTPEADYTYIYCGQNGGITMRNPDGTSTSINTVNETKTEKIFVTFTPEESLHAGASPEFKQLEIGVASFSYNPSITNYVSDDDGTYKSDRRDGLAAIGNNFAVSTVMTFHNSEIIVKAYDSNNVGGRAVKFKLPTVPATP